MIIISSSFFPTNLRHLSKIPYETKVRMTTSQILFTFVRETIQGKQKPYIIKLQCLQIIHPCLQEKREYFLTYCSCPLTNQESRYLQRLLICTFSICRVIVVWKWIFCFIKQKGIPFFSY